MSRGLGKLQRVVLSTLNDAKELHTVYTGRNDGERVFYHRCEVRLPDDVYDMRASLQFLARAMKRAMNQVRRGYEPRLPLEVKASFGTALYRAVRRLVESGYLEQWSAPLYHDAPQGVITWANRRLVKRTEKAFSAISTDMYNAYLQTYTEHRRVAEERLARIYRQLSLRMNDVRVTAENTFHPCW
jgi:hypothetical protein